MTTSKPNFLRRFCSKVWNLANARKEKMLAIINDDEQWSAYCIDKKLTPSMQKFVLLTYGIKKEPVEIVKTDITKSNHSTKESESNDFDSHLVTLWTGNTKSIEFTYESFHGEKLRRTINPTEVCFNDNDEFYIKGICLTRNAPRTFKACNITTKIKIGSKLYEFAEWCEDVLNVDLYSA
ncbi:hypothetical protein AKG98_3532 [Moritella sp. JT01]|uniref:WYL domain-containing protein n=1 Tax=Moritella sp. JT01 TaxID=756698 RepID=UPI000799C2B0|nr:WYL domain-containing protein [Moritella sp. JT01]KXO13307.1 hypothetical protein AKG98_3532 [Moritella sp. JT01]